MYTSSSKTNHDKINELLQTLTAIKNETKVNIISPNKMEKLRLDDVDQNTSWIPTDEGAITKRSNAPTDRDFRHERARNRYDHPTPVDDLDSTVKDISFHRWAKELKLEKSSIMSLATEEDELKSYDAQHSIEGLIYELRQEYQLNDSDVTQLRFDIDKTINGNQTSMFGKSIISNDITANLTQKVDKESLKTNMLLNLMNKRLSKVMDDDSLKNNKGVYKRASQDFSSQAKKPRSKLLKHQRMSLVFHSNIFFK
jgi:hypothetical protein